MNSFKLRKEVIKRSLGAVAVALLIAASFAGTASAMNFAEYSRACKANGGSAYIENRVYKCKFSSGGGGGGGSPGEDLGRALGNAIACKLLNNCPGGDSDNGAGAVEQQRQEQQRLEDEQAAAAEKKRKDDAELEQQRKDADERHRQEEIKKQAKFEQERNEGAKTLRGSTGIRITPNTPGGTALRGSAVDTGIRDIKPAKEARDLGGANAAWKQLNCAAAISGYAFAALSNTDKPDYDEFRNLAGEAINALNGERLGVQCPAAPSAPAAYGREGYERYAAKYKALLERGQKLAEDLAQTRAKRKDALDRLIEAKSAVADPKAQSELDKLRAQQTQLNEQQDKKYAALRDEQRKLNAENDKKLDDVRQKQREINAGNQQQADEMKKRALAEALAAQRTAQNEYSKNTQQEAHDQKELDALKKAADGISSGDANAMAQLEKVNW